MILDLLKKYTVVDPMGQYNHPGKVTTIPGGPNGTPITMKGVKGNLLGYDNLGNKKLMKPGKEYFFPGSEVTEIPIAQNGKEVPYYQEMATETAIPGADDSPDFQYGGILSMLEKYQSGGRIKKQLSKEYPVLENIYGKNLKNVKLKKDKNFRGIEFYGNDLPEYSDAYPDHPNKGGFGIRYNPKKLENKKEDILGDLLHGIHYDKAAKPYYNKFFDAAKNHLQDSMEHWWNKEKENDIDGREQWERNYIDGYLRQYFQPNHSEYEIFMSEYSPEMTEAAEEFKTYLKKYQQGGQVIKVKGVDGKIREINTDSDEYRDLYKKRLINTYDPETGEYIAPPLDEVEVVAQPPKSWKDFASRFSGSFDGSSPLSALSTIITAPLSFPQAATTYWLSGDRSLTPSQAFKIQNPVGAFAVDAVADPTNLFGVGLVDDAFKLSTKVGNPIKKFKAFGTTKVDPIFLQPPGTSKPKTLYDLINSLNEYMKYNGIDTDKIFQSQELASMMSNNEKISKFPQLKKALEDINNGEDLENLYMYESKKKEFIDAVYSATTDKNILQKAKEKFPYKHKPVVAPVVPRKTSLLVDNKRITTFNDDSVENTFKFGLQAHAPELFDNIPKTKYKSILEEALNNAKRQGISFNNAETMNTKDASLMLRDYLADQILKFKKPLIKFGEPLHVSGADNINNLYKYNQQYDLLPIPKEIQFLMDEHDITKLTPKELNLVDAYTRGYDKSFNFREKTEPFGEHLYSFYGDLLNEATQKNKLTKELVVNRGTRDYQIPLLNERGFSTGVTKFKRDLEIGDIFKDDGFISTAFKPGATGFGSPHTSELIYIPKGSNLSHIVPETGSWPQFNGEREIILPRGLMRKVTGFNDVPNKAKFITEILNPYKNGGKLKRYKKGGILDMLNKYK